MLSITSGSVRSLVLTDAFSSSSGAAVDENLDGSIDDMSIFSTIYNAVSVSTRTNLEAAFGPGIAFRDRTTKEWYAKDSAGIHDTAGNTVSSTAFNSAVVGNTGTSGALNPVR